MYFMAPGIDVTEWLRLLLVIRPSSSAFSVWPATKAGNRTRLSLSTQQFVVYDTLMESRLTEGSRVEKIWLDRLINKSYSATERMLEPYESDEGHVSLFPFY